MSVSRNVQSWRNWIPAPDANNNISNISLKYFGFDDLEEDAPFVLVIPPYKLKSTDDETYPEYHMLGYVFARCGFRALFFTYRDAPASDELVNEDLSKTRRDNSNLIDAKYVFQWAKDKYPKASQVWIAGVEFGSFIGMQLLMRYTGITGFVGVSVPLSEYDVSFLSPFPVQGCFFHGVQNDETPIECVEQFIEEGNSSQSFERYPKLELVKIEGASSEFSSGKPIEDFVREAHRYISRAYTSIDLTRV